MSLQTFVNSTYASFASHLAPFSFLTVDYLEKILVITADGRTLVGTLLSCDQLTNIVLNETMERIIRHQDDPEPSSEVSHGLYLLRADNITICGLVAQDLDKRI